MSNYVIIGAGISGLALGWFLKKNHPEIHNLTILDAGNRPGGWIQTITEDEFLFEQGPRSFRSHGTGKVSLSLIEELGLSQDVIFADKGAKKRHLYSNSQLNHLPSCLFSLITSPFKFKLFRAMWNDWRSQKGSGEDESIYSFTSRRFGKRAAELFFDPLASGIFAGDIRQLSIKSCFPWLQELEKNHGCVWRGAMKMRKMKTADISPSTSPFVNEASKEELFTLKNGVQSLTDTLANKLSNELKLNCPAKTVELSAQGINIELNDGSTMRADKIFFALPPKQLAKLLEKFHSDIATELRAIPSASVAIVNVGYKNSYLKQKGFGYLVPTQEKQQLLGVVFDSSVFPQQNNNRKQTRLTAMIGGAHCTNFDSYSDNDLIGMTLEQLHTHLGIGQIPDTILIKKAHNAIPQYIVGHHANVESIEKQLHALSSKAVLLGNGFHGISINDCIARAQAIAKGA